MTNCIYPFPLFYLHLYCNSNTHNVALFILSSLSFLWDQKMHLSLMVVEFLLIHFVILSIFRLIGLNLMLKISFKKPDFYLHRTPFSFEARRRGCVTFYWFWIVIWWAVHFCPHTLLGHVKYFIYYIVLFSSASSGNKRDCSFRRLAMATMWFVQFRVREKRTLSLWRAASRLWPFSEI